MSAAPNEAETLIARLDEIVETLTDHPDEAVREATADLVAGLRWLHTEGLARLVGLLAEEPRLFRDALDDPHVANLLLLHDLVMVDERERAAEALDSVRPLLRSHGGEVELVAVDEGVVRVRLLGACDGCPSSAATLRQGIERALAERLPGFRALQVEDDAAAGPAPSLLEGPGRREERAAAGESVSFVPVDTLTRLEERVRRAEGSEADSGDEAREAVIGPVDDVAEGLNGFLGAGYPILLVRIGGTIRAYQNTCPGSFLPLHLGPVADGVVTCPWHGCRFDLDSGERIGAGPTLHRLDLEIEGGEVRVRW